MLTAEHPMSNLASDLAKCKVTSCPMEEAKKKGTCRLIKRPGSTTLTIHDSPAGVISYTKHEGRMKGEGHFYVSVNV